MARRPPRTVTQALDQPLMTRPPEIPGIAVECQVGEGGFAVVWKGRRVLPSGVERDVAIKILRPEAGPATELAKRLRDEGRVLGRLQHRAIVRLEDVIEVDGRPALVTEFVEGQDLSDLARRRAITGRALCEVVAELAGALEAAHAGVSDGQGGRVPVVHRDVKPSNVRLTPWGEVKLMDFGSARALTPDREAETQFHLLVTHDYAAPEANQAQAVPASDVYSLGVVAWELLVGDRLGRLSGEAQRHGSQLGRALSKVEDPTFAGLVAPMLAFEPSARPTAGQVRAQWQAVQPLADGAVLRDWLAGDAAASPDITRPVPRRNSGRGAPVREDETAPVSIPPRPDPVPAAAPAPSAPPRSTGGIGLMQLGMLMLAAGIAGGLVAGVVLLGLVVAFG